MQELQDGDPRRIGPYRLVGRLGAGGMGMVFAARSAGGRAVAVKVIRGELAGDAEFRVRFSREVAAARRVSGLFTAAVVDADADGPVPWLATAYVPGPSLSDAVRRHGALPAASVLALAAGLAEGLAAIHAAGLIHRDLKPSNVLLAEDGPRVIDFGISRAAEATALTHADLVIGSPGFMSPEQAEGRETGAPSDVFSFGAVLAFAATGTGPFGAGSTAALVYRVDGADLAAGWLPAPIIKELSRHAEIPDPAEPAPPLPAPEASVLTLTAAKPDQSHPSSPPSPLAQAASLPGGPQRRRRRPMTAALMLTGVLVVAAAGTAVGLNLTRDAPASSHRPHNPPTSAAPQSSRALTAAGPGSSSPGVRAPAAPTDVAATAMDQHTIRVTWTDSASDVTGFTISNGCGTDGCSGGAINVRTGKVTTAEITTSPGAYQCFYVQAFNSSGTSTSPAPGCTSTPGITMPTNQEWTDTGVTVRSGAAIGISATGAAYLAAAGSSQAPAGDPSCKPATRYAADGSQFPAPHLPCWSLIARIGHGQTFEVGSSILVTATSGRLYLGVNDDSFSGNTGIWTVKIKIGGLP